MIKKELIKKIKVVCVKRLNNSINGNPKFQFNFENGGVITTPTDAGFVYGFSQHTFLGKFVDVVYHHTEKGKAILNEIKLTKSNN